MFKKTYFILFVAATFVGCKKDPQLQGPLDSYSSATYPSTLAELNSVLAPCYSNLRTPGLYGFNFLPKALANITHTANSMYNGDQGWNEMAAGDLSVTNSYSQDAWINYYAGIKHCNVLFDAAKLYLSKNADANASDIEAVNYIQGQAYFLRAFHYYNLECLFGESYISKTGGDDKMGVPIFDKLPTTIDSTQQPRATARQVWNFIISDLKQSIILLQGKVNTDEPGRISEWAAKGLLGKVYVFTQDWENAKNVLLDVIQHSGKSLMPYDKYKDAFIGITANEYNEESLFELQIDQDAKGGYGLYSGVPNVTSINGLIWPPWALGDDGTEGTAYPMGYGNEFLHDKNVSRFGFNLGSYTLVNNPGYNGLTGPKYNNPEKIMDPIYKQNSLQARSNNTCDPRLFASALQPWVDSVKPDGTNWHPVSIVPMYSGQAGKYGWSMKKYSPIFNNINNVGPADAANIYFLRLADIYLLYAEATMGSGDNTTALEYLNKVKRRAYSYPVDIPSPVDYISLTDETTAKAGGDPVLGNNPLYYERYAELFNEGHWWYDVCRWKIGPSETAYFQDAINVPGTLVWKDKTYSWPIPQAELNSNAAVKGQQNPGYPQ